MATYFTLRNTAWALALLSWPACWVARWLAPDARPADSFELLALALWFIALSYSPKAIVDYRKKRLRLKNGACLRCGYDLQGTLDAAVRRCPECGEEIPAWRITLHANRRR